MEYRVRLDIFDGPLDLLLHLIRRHELDVTEIALVQITDSYLRHVDLLREMAKRGEGAGVDINTVGEFLVIAATLLEMKSATLLPKPPTVSNDERGGEPADPRFELVRQLLEYKRIRDAADRLETRRAEVSERFPRWPAKVRLEGEESEEGDDAPPLRLEEVQVWDLLEHFERLMAEVGRRGPARHEVTYDDTPIDLHAADIADRVQREHRVTLRGLLLGRQTRSEMVGMFLALLELVRQKRVLVEVEEDDLAIIDAPEEHKKSFEEQMMGGDLPPREREQPT